jgi:[protein-PII] uridylyltransferase
VTTTLPHPQLLSKTELLERLQQSDAPLIAAVKRLMEQFREQADQYFRQTLDARVPVKYRASQIDALIAALWCHSGLDQPQLALVAVGGYGRGELHPFSDIDLLLLCEDEQAIQQHGEGLQRFITLLWDIKLDVGHSVRTLVDCRRESANDLTIITNMLESRLLIGSEELFGEFRQIVDCRDHWPPEIFFQQKWQELQDRHDKHNDSEYNLEPNVKNSPGALRDIQTLCWVTLRHFGGQSGLLDLKENGFLTEFEYIRLNDSLNFLWQVRYALHMIAGREEDRLLFDLQREIAELLGFEAEGNLLSVERFMMRVYRNQLATLEICDVLLLHFNETFMKAHQPPNLIRLNEHFVLNNGYLQVNDPTLFTREPIWLLKVFQLCAHTENLIGVHSDTIRALRDNRNQIDELFRSNRDHNAIFMELIRNEHHVVRELTRMMRYGILGRYIPEFGKIIGQMEHDLLHVYTVDDHTFRMIRFMRHLRFSDQRIKFPVASRLIHRVNKPELLYLAALLHDTGKYLDGDHTQTGAQIADAFCRQHNLRPTEGHIVSWLIENHLTMPHACQHLDLNNPEHIHQFAQQMGDQHHLDMLYLLTVADTYTTNPKLWTNWRSQLMQILYTNTRNALRRGLTNPINKEEHIEEIQAQALSLLATLEISEIQAKNVWDIAGDDYFIRESVDSIVWHTRSIIEHPDNSPLVALRQTPSTENEGSTEIFIYVRNHDNLFAATTATLDQLNLNIQDARIVTSDSENLAMDTYTVLDESYQPIADSDRLNRIRDAILDTLLHPEDYNTIIQRRTPRLLKYFPIPTQVVISNDPSLQRTILEVIAADRPGLLARVGAILSDFNAQFLGARILTEGEKVSDIFFIVDEQGLPYSNPDTCQALIDAVKNGLDDQVQVQSAV